MDICCCLPPDRTWHKVNDYSGDLGEGKIGNKLRLKPCWSVLLIDPLSAMWVQWGKHFHESIFGSGYVCQVIASTRQQGLVLYIGDKGCSSPTQRWPSQSWVPFVLESAIDFDIPFGMNARQPSKSQESIIRYGVEQSMERSSAFPYTFM